MLGSSDLQAAPGHGIALGPNGKSPYTSMQIEYSQPALSAASPVLAINISYPRVVLLNRFIEDVIYAGKTLQVGPTYI